MTVEELMGRMSALELTEWMAYFEMHAAGEDAELTPEETVQLLEGMPGFRRAE